MSAMDTFWLSCLEYFEKELNAQQFNTWIKPLRLDPSPGTHDELTLVAPNRFVMQWIKDNFLSHIERMAKKHFARDMHFQLKLADQPSKMPGSAADSAAAESPSTLSPAPPFLANRAPKGNTPSRLNPAFTFDSFVTGKANQLARAGAIQVAERPGVAYNPLFIYGGVGLGKTHLIQAIGNLVLEQNSQAKVRYIHAEQYVSDVVRAYQHKAFDDFKQYYHSLDLLLIDDIQFFGGKSRTQEEFFYAFNALIEAHKQVIITCDSYPKEISGMEERLVSRFGWGLTVAVEPPELEMRVAILLKKAQLEKIELDESVAFFIAKHIRSNVRELEGALKRVLAYSRFTNHPLSLDLAKEALKDLLAVQNRQISIENIQKTVADYYKIKVAEMYSKKRSRIVARPRQMAMAMAKELTPLSLPDIGEAFGGRDHTTVLHGYRKIAELRASDPNINRDFNTLLHILRG
uniref:Chromosomal replication initiator protein DnaA n=2 Tax=unclassified Nitrosovibrio TaxID=2624428 RepID=Q075F9_9PROT|nr:DNA replication initiator protein [Nitrosovibrio sp. FJI82]ABB69890.1 DNA replication initiator protein [Nitrosovibrio sp. RY3C]